MKPVYLILFLLVSYTVSAHEAPESSTKEEAHQQTEAAPNEEEKTEEEAKPAVKCEERKKKWWIFRTKDMKWLGGSVTEAECKKAVEASKHGVVCAKVGGGLSGVEASNDWKPVNIDTKKELGRYAMPLKDCANVSENAGEGVVCTFTGVMYGKDKGMKPTNIKTNEFLGSSSRMKYCVKATRASKNGKTCRWNGSGDGSGRDWVVTRLKDGSLVSAGGTVEECAKKL